MSADNTKTTKLGTAEVGWSKLETEQCLALAAALHSIRPFYIKGQKPCKDHAKGVWGGLGIGAGMCART